MANEAERILPVMLEKTRAKEVPWTEVDSLREDAVVVRFSLASSAVEVVKNSTSGRYTFRILNNTGQSVAAVSAAANGLHYDSLRELFDLALRQARRVDPTLAEIEAFLRKSGGPNR